MKDNLSTYSSSVSAQLQPSPCSERLASWLWEGSSLRISARKKKKKKDESRKKKSTTDTNCFYSCLGST